MPKITYKIQTQLISIHKEDGTRIHFARKRGWRDWDRHKERLENVRDAVAYADRVISTLTLSEWGCIVVVRRVVDGHSTQVYEKIYQAKIGTDNLPFIEFSGIAGDYWKRLLGK